MPDLKTHVAQALQVALTQAIPDSPSGSHRILVVGQLVVNIQAEHHDERCTCAQDQMRAHPVGK